MPQEDEIIAKLDAETQKKEDSIEQNKYDEVSGALKESLLHRELGEIFNKSLEFDTEGHVTIKPGGENVFFEAITARDLMRVNQVSGHLGGNTYLKSVFQTTQEFSRLFGKEQSSMFHTIGADFILCGRLEEPKVEALESSLDTYMLPFSENETPAKISSVSLSLEDAVEFYNLALDQLKEVESQSDEENYNFKKLFTGQILQLLSFRQEYQKLLDTYSDLRVYERSTKTDRSVIEEEFSKYSAHMFKGYGIDKFSDFDQVKNIPELLFQIAYERIYYEGNIPLKVWTSLDKNVFEYAQASRQFEEQSIKKQIENDIYGEILEDPKKVSGAFKLEKYVYKTNEGRLLNELATAIKLLPETAEQYQDLEALQKYYYITSLLAQIYPENEDIENFSKAVNESCGKVVDAQIRIALGETVASDWTVENDINRLQHFKKFTEAAYEDLLLFNDPLTGLPNRDSYRKRIQEWQEKYAADNQVGVISIDMGFLKYFNYIGTRETGDLALNKTAYILEKVMEKATEQGLLVEIFRTGGDEFQVLVNGKKENMAKIMQMIEAKKKEQDLFTEVPIGIIPKHPESRITYQPEMLQFDVGFAHTEDAKEMLALMTSLDESLNPFSVEENKIYKAILNGEILSPEQMTRYYEALTEIQDRLADKIITTNKQTIRFELLYKRFVDLYTNPDIGKLPDDFDGSIPIEKEYYKWHQYQELVTFSGKAMNGRGISHFYRTFKHAQELGIDINTATEAELNQLTEYFYEGAATIGSQDSLENIVSMFRKSS